MNLRLLELLVPATTVVQLPLLQQNHQVIIFPYLIYTISSCDFFLLAPIVKLQPRKKKSKADEVDELLVKILHSLQENKKSTRDLDEEGHYGEQIAATLRRFTVWQKALAKMKIQELLFNIKFDSEHSTPTPAISYTNYQPMNYHTPDHYYSQNLDY